jgi:hypothetical protein
LVVFHEREIQKPWFGRLVIYFIKWENFLISLKLVKINTYAKISINGLLTYSSYEKCNMSSTFEFTIWDFQDFQRNSF